MDALPKQKRKHSRSRPKSVYHRLLERPVRPLRIRVHVRALAMEADRRGGLLDQVDDLVAFLFRLILGELLDADGNQVRHVEAWS